jgi:hypothetical protein
MRNAEVNMPDAQRNDDRNTAAVVATNRPRRSWRGIAGIVLAVAITVVLLSVWASLWWKTRCPLASIEAADVASMQLRLFRHHWNSVIFAPIDRKLIPDVLASLKPCRHDAQPADWVVLGMLDIDLKDGSRCTVTLYRTGQELAAFSIDQAYYRGGSDRDLRRLLQLEAGTHNGAQGNLGR